MSQPARSSSSSLLAAVLLLSAACAEVGDPAGPTGLLASKQAGVTASSGGLLPDHYLVQFKAEVGNVRGLARQLVSEAGGQLGFVYTAAIKGFSATLPAAALTALQRNPNVASVEQDQLVHAVGTEANPTWGLDRIDQRALPLDQSYSYTTDGAGVNVYIIDTGIRTTHVEFGGRAFGAYTAISDGYGTDDCAGHGTHVAGTVGGSSYGVAKAVKLYAVRVLNCQGSGTVSGVVAGVDWVTQHRILPAVANMSLGGGLSSTLTTAVQNSIASGVVYAVAAGNSSTDACTQSPANTATALTVAASTSDDQQASFSNYGSCVDLYAPGVSITSSYNTSDVATAVLSGTSMASPHVAGAAALYLALNPGATPAGVAAALVANSTAGLLTGVTLGTPNLLLYSLSGTGTPPPPPPPALDQPPVASFTANCPKGNCSFDASGSSDDVGIVNYAWDFGDGSTLAGALAVKVTHKYAAAGSYTVTLTVTDSAGQSSQAKATLKVRKAA